MIKVVIIGAGFAGLEVAKQLKNSNKHEVIICDKHNFHLFQPLLYQVAAAVISPSEIAVPVRNEFRNCSNVYFLLDNFLDINLKQKKVIFSNNIIDYDILILACGSETNYFGHDKWKNYVTPLKSLQDAREIRNQVLINYELYLQEKIKLSSIYNQYVIIGGGPTGVEMAGSISELISKRISNFKKKKKLNPTKVFLIEKGDRILPSFPKKLSQKAYKYLNDLNVSVLLNSEVQNISKNSVTVNGEKILSSCIIWAAGMGSNKINNQLPFNKSNDGRIIVNSDLSVPGHKSIYVLGDQAYFKDKNQMPLQGLASVAKQQGIYLGKKLIGNKKNDFNYKNWGQLATIGTNKAVADFGLFTLSGYLAWLVWSLVHIFLLVGFKNRILVMFNWIWTYITYSPNSQVIDENIDYFENKKQPPDFKQAKLDKEEHYDIDGVSHYHNKTFLSSALKPIINE